MRYSLPLIFLLTSSRLVSSFPEGTENKEVANKEAEPKPEDLLVEKLSKNEQNPQKREEPNTENVEKGRNFGGPPLALGRQQFPVLGQYGLGYLEPQIQFPAFNFVPQDKQPGFPRVQPQVLLYGPGGQGQPILINPGHPPGNFLVPQAPGPNVVLRSSPGPGVFAGDFPKPAHVPPIEKDAEEIPTNPAKIPPLYSSPTTVRPRPSKPEKLETFNEGKNELPTRNEIPHIHYPKLSPDSLRPGQRFFFLNGANLYPEFIQTQLQNSEDLNDYARPFPIPGQFQSPEGGVKANTVDTPSASGTSHPFEGGLNIPPGGFGNVSPLTVSNQPLEYFRGIPFGVAGEVEAPEFGRFRFTPPGAGNVFPFREDAENDAIIVDANFERDASSATNGDSGGSALASASDSSTAGPSMAQAAPGAVALAGPGGVAGAAPRGTALVGRGGLAVASPQATAVAGTRDDDEKRAEPAAGPTTKSSAEKPAKD